MAVPNTFATKTGTILLSELDENFSTAITIGTTSVALGSTTTSIDGLDNLAYTGTLTGGTGVVAIGTNQIYKDASGNVGIGTSGPIAKLEVGTLVDTTPATFTGTLKVTGTTQTTLASVGGIELPIASGYGIKIQALSASGSALAFASRYDSATWVETMRIDSSGNVTLQKNISVGGAAPTTVGTGVTFPGAQSASSNGNTLDDYEEGTYVPVTSAGIVFVGTATKTGFYTKIGNLVTATFYLQGVTSVTPAAASTVSLPFIATPNGIGHSTNFGGTTAPVGLLAVINTSTVQYITAMTASPNIVGTVTYTTTT